ncbi:MAG: DUF4242 domain-containing protein [Pseudomonadota bacterium]
MKRYIIEREIPDVDRMNAAELRGAANRSNAALAQLAPRVQWLESFVTRGKTFCVYLAEDEAAVQEHARLSGFPANTISQVFRIIDPATAA